MILMVNTIKRNTDKKIVGYIDTGKVAYLPVSGFIEYMDSNGYQKTSVTKMSRPFTRIEMASIESFQNELSNALMSLEYYPKSDKNDTIRTLYFESHPMK